MSTQREIKFRCWHPGHVGRVRVPASMFYDTWSGECLKFLKEGQPVVVMQYTGLRDKNGKEIYEGDVLNYTNGTYRPDGKTKHEPHVTRVIVTIDPKGMYCNVSHFSLVTNSLEVIGNIHENPDLIP